MNRALLLCNSIYPNDTANLCTLSGPGTDGLWLWQALTDERVGVFSRADVSVLFERSKEDALARIERFFSSAASTDTLLFYFSGHGYSAGDSLYLCVRDSVVKRIRSSALSTDEISKMVGESHAAAVVIILDCCFSGAFKGTVPSNLGGNGRYVISATTTHALAQDAEEDGIPSPFTAALIDSLASGARPSSRDDVIDLDDLFLDLQNRVPADGPRPKRDFDGAGRIAIARRPSQTPSTDPSPAASSKVTPPSDEDHHRLQFAGSSHLTHLVKTPRRRGDLTRGDLLVWRASVLLGLLTLVLGAASLNVVVNRAPGYFMDQLGIERILASVACGLGLLIALSGLLEGFRLRWMGVSRMGRRRAVEALTRRPPWWILWPALLAAVGSLGLLISPLSGKGIVFNYWVGCIACAAAFLGLNVTRLIGFGDELVITAAALLVVGNVVPIYYGSRFDGGPFRSGAQSAMGLVWITLGLLLVGAWYWRSPVPVLVGIVVGLALSLLASAADVVMSPAPHWVITAAGTLVATFGLWLGCGMPLPLQERSD